MARRVDTVTAMDTSQSLMNVRAFLRWLVSCAFVFAVVSVMADSALPKEPVVELPTFVVEEKVKLPPKEKWRYGTIPAFEILSEISDKDTEALVRDIQTAIQVGEYNWPVKIKTDKRITVIFCKNERSCNDFGFIENTRKISPLTTRYYITPWDWEHHFVIYNTSRLLSQKTWHRMMTFYGLRIAQTEPRQPHWMSLAASFANRMTSVEKDEIRTSRKSIDHLDIRRRPRLSNLVPAKSDIPNDTVVVVTGKGRTSASKYVKEQGLPFEFSMAFRVFSEICLLNKNARYEKPFIQFINRARLEPVSQELFKECFGKDLIELEKEVSDYLGRANFIKAVPSKTIKTTLEYAPLALRDATDAEVGRVKGEALAFMQAPKIPPRLMLRAPYARGERDPRLLAAIGLHEYKIGNIKEARRFLEEAVRQKVDRPRAYIELAQIYYDDARKSANGKNGKLSVAQIKLIMALLDDARALPQTIPEVYDMIAEVCANAESQAAQPWLGTIDEGLQAFPYHAELFCQGAAAFANAGYYKEAAKLVSYRLTRFRYYEPQYRERLEQVRATLPK